MRTRFTRFRPVIFRVWVFMAVVLVGATLTPAWASQTTKRDYKKALKTWTRDDELFQRPDFYASMKWSVTYLSPSFVRAQNDELARIYNRLPSEKDAALRGAQSRYGGYEAFFVSFYGYDYKTADLAKKDSIWLLRLEVNGRRYEPVKIEPLSKPTPIDIDLYPYINTWARYYTVYFPKVSGIRSGDVTLHIHGPDAEGALSW